MLFYGDFIFFQVIFLILLINWYLYLSSNVGANVSSEKSDVLKKTILKKKSFFFYLKTNNINLLLVIVLFSSLKLTNNNVWFNHFEINESRLWLFYTLYLFSIFFALFFSQISMNRVTIYNDYFFIILNLFILLPNIFLINNIFTLIFFLELISCLIFYKLTILKFWYNKNKKINKKIFFSKNFSNLLFFQYWLTFFSTIILLFSYINIVAINGTSEFYLYNLLFLLNDSYYSYFLAIFLFMGIFLKVGISPFHLFKIEIYKNVPFISILFYTTYYFLIFFLFLGYLMFFMLYEITKQILNFLLLFVVFSTLFIITLLFDVNFTKSFFAYSTLINAVFFSLILITNFI